MTRIGVRVVFQSSSPSNSNFSIHIVFFSPLENQSEDKVLEKLRKMDLDEDDDIDNLLTVSKNCRPILEHKLVNRVDFISFRFEKFV